MTVALWDPLKVGCKDFQGGGLQTSLALQDPQMTGSAGFQDVGSMFDGCGPVFWENRKDSHTARHFS